MWPGYEATRTCGLGMSLTYMWPGYEATCTCGLGMGWDLTLHTILLNLQIESQLS